jgi:SAM-dependent methyltransferase
MSSKLDTRAIGLDVGLSFIRWLTGAENLHYGLWTGLAPSAANLRAAQDAYTEKLFALLPEGRPLRILDIGGGAGETAKKLLALGHAVEIVVPSPFLAARCRENAPAAKVHECTFQDFAGGGRFDLCLFSESFQYIPMETALSKSLGLLAEGGRIVIADCFRTEAYRGRQAEGPKPGGGHNLVAFRAAVEGVPLSIESEEDITEAVAPSIDVEQGLYHVFGHGLTRIDGELAAKKPAVRWLLGRVIGLFLSARRRAALKARLTGQERTSAVFLTYNRYLMLRLCPAAGE